MALGEVGILYHPHKILKERGHKSEIMSSILMMLFICVAWYFEDITFIYVGVSELFCLFFGGQFLRNVSQLIEEMYHLNSRYSSSIWLAVKVTIFSVNSVTKWSLLTTSFILINHWFIYGSTSLLFWKICHWQSFVCIFSAVYVFSRMINIEYTDLNFGVMLENMCGLDFGSGMAYSFFYGYLKIILPDTGTLKKGIKEKIANYEAINGVTFAVPKLFILIPSSTYCPPTLQSISKGWMEPGESLEPEEIDRAGVKKRSFKNCVYKMRRPNSTDKYIYIVAEGATPLQTLYDIMNHNTRYGKYYSLYYKEIVSKFYFTLCDIIQNDRDCVDLCQLIYYNDIDDNGTEVNVAEIIFDVINTQYKN